MKEVLVDTDILSYYFQGDTKVVENFREYFKSCEKINVSIITYYEILSGLKHKDPSKHLSRFRDFVNQNYLFPLTRDSVEVSSELYGRLRKDGKTIDDIDLLIAGIAISNDLILVTNNERHFKKLDGLDLLNWKK